MQPIKRLNKDEKDGANLELLKKKDCIEFSKRLWYLSLIHIWDTSRFAL